MSNEKQTPQTNLVIGDILDNGKTIINEQELKSATTDAELSDTPDKESKEFSLVLTPSINSVIPYNPHVALDDLIKYYKAESEKYGDAVLHLETAKYKINNIK